MIRTRDTGEIYLISLDTFMIMAVMGLTLGTIFFIINPNLTRVPEPDVEITFAYLNNDDYNIFLEYAQSNNDNTGYLSIDEEMKYYGYRSIEGWEVLILFTNDTNNRMKAEISATRSDRTTVRGIDRIRNYLLRVEEFSRRWSY